MILPYGHERTTVRRLPWVTFALMGLCLVVFVLTSLSSHRTGGQVDDLFGEFFLYLTAHPYLELDPEFERELHRIIPEHEFAAFRESARELGARKPTHPRQVEHEQRELDEIVRQIMTVLQGVKRTPMYRFGLVPAEVTLHATITYQFLHGGFFHLFGNLFFLFLAGPFIEDVWGRPLFAAFYLTAGVVAGMMFAVRYPDLDVPLIGASGAVAGVMGAFLVRYWRTKIKFWYFFFPFRPGTFAAPAWLMLPLWFARELLFAQAWDVAAPGAGGGGVAHWAHVWGFAFGLVVAGAIGYWKVEERFIHQSIESKITLVDNPMVEEALAARAEGDLDRSLELLASAVEQEPDNVDAVLALWNAELDAGRPARAAPYLMRALRSAARANDETLILNHWQELIEAVPAVDVEPGLAARVAELLLRDGRQQAAAATVALAAERVDGNTAVGPLVRLARAAEAAQSAAAGTIAGEALARADLPDEIRAEVEAIAARVGVVPTAAALEADPDAAPDAIEPALQRHGIQVMEAIPQTLENAALLVTVDGAHRRMDLGRVEAIAVGGVLREGKRPVVVVDLMLDGPWSDREELRVVRLVSTSFDPRMLVAGDEVEASFRALLERLLELSEAVPLPDPEAARGRPFRTYPSVDEYQRRVLGVA